MKNCATYFLNEEKAGFEEAAETAAIALNYFDRFLSKHKILSRLELKLAIEACLSLSLRIHDDVAMQHGNIHAGA
jgi:hypothetical protein